MDLGVFQPQNIFCGANIDLPMMVAVRQSFNAPVVRDVGSEVAEQLNRQIERGASELEGARIAVAVGSRGIPEMSSIVATLIQWLKEKGADPFVVPAMGSHGGASAHGQAEVLARYGVTREQVGAQVISSMDVLEIGKVDGKLPVFVDKNAFEADGIFVVNRIKPHTQFHSDIESGLLKMMIVGLGNKKGASLVHAQGIRGLTEYIPKAARVLLASGKILGGIGIIENAYHQIAHIVAVKPNTIEDEEKRLLARARDLMPTLPIDCIDLLILDEIGKDISGPGMDSSVTGRIMAKGFPDPPRPDIKVLAALDLTLGSEGNATGIGVADIVTRRLVKKIDRRATYLNTLVGRFPIQGKIPMFFDSDVEMMHAAGMLTGVAPASKLRIVRVKNTLALADLLVSETLLDEIGGIDRVEVVGVPCRMTFDSFGLFTPFKEVISKSVRGADRIV
jgi:hypothetical protein